MGVDVQLRLYERSAIARLTEALGHWRSAREPAPFLEVLHRVLDRVRANAPVVEALKARDREIERELAARPAPSSSGPDPRVIAELAAKQRAAMASRDPAAFIESTSALSNVFADEFRRAAAADPVRTSLVNEKIRLLLNRPGPWIEASMIERVIAVLEDPRSAPEEREDAVREGTFLDGYALAWDRTPQPDCGVARGNLPGWLIDNSNWLGSLVAGSGASGDVLELSEETRLFTSQDLLRFRNELAQLPPAPTASIRERLEEVRRLVDLALSDPDLVLGLYVG